jgi:hypothetical protein
MKTCEVCHKNESVKMHKYYLMCKDCLQKAYLKTLQINRNQLSNALIFYVEVPLR